MSGGDLKDAKTAAESERDTPKKKQVTKHTGSKAAQINNLPVKNVLVNF